MKKYLLLTVFSLSFFYLQGQCFDDRHNSTIANSWVSCSMSSSPDENDTANRHWIMYDLGANYELYQMTLWNYNHIEELTRGVQSLKISLSDNGQDFIEAATVNVPMADGSSTYEGSNVYDFGGTISRYILLTAISNYGAPCTGMSEMRVMLTSGNAVPVELAEFNVNKQDIDGLIDWTSATEINVNYYSLERSFSNANEWQEIHYVTVDGDSYVRKSYDYVDKGVANYLAKDERVYYRLKMVDLDGQYEYSDVKVLLFDDIASTENLRMSPNPVASGSQINLEYDALFDAPESLTITDMQGKLIYQQSINSQNGINTTSISLPKTLISGIYVIQLGQGKQAKLIVD